MLPQPNTLCCPHCKGTVACRDDLAGQVVGCPHCKKPFRMPGVAPTPTRWYLARNGQRSGPFLLPHLRQMVQTGQLQPSDMLLREGEQTWKPAQSMDGIFQPCPPPQALVSSTSCIPVDDTPNVPVVRPGEDFFRREAQLTIDRDEPPAETTELLSDPPTLANKVTLGAGTGALSGALLCCLIVTTASSSVVVVLTLPFLAMLLGGLLGGAIGQWILYPRALDAHREAIEGVKAWQENERRRKAQGTQCPSCGREFSRIELVRGTILAGPVEIRPVLKKHFTTGHLSSPFDLGHTFHKSSTGLEPARTRKSYLISLYKCRFCGHTWEDRDDEGHREIGPDGQPLANFAYESLHDAVGRKLRGG